MKKLCAQSAGRRAQGPWKGVQGFSMVEVMAALFISGFIALSAFTIMSTQERASSVNTRVTEMQQNVRIGMELITQDLRTAGFGMDGAVGACGTAIVPADQNAGGVDLGPDSISIVAPTPISTLAVAFNGSPVANQITLQAGDVAANAPFGAVGDTVSINGLVTRTVSAVAGDVVTLNTNVGAPATFPIGTPVYWLQCITYDVVANAVTCGGATTCLRRGGVPIADGIEDLQFAYACDGCVPVAPNPALADDIIDDQPATIAGFDAADFIFDNTWAAAPVTADTIRLVRVTLVAREMQAGGTSETGTIAVSTPAALQVEDHNHANWFNATYQQFRRRVVTRTIEIRNLGL